MTDKIRCVVVDDEPLAIELLEKHIEQFSQLQLVASCQQAIKAFEVLNKEPVDLLFLDIQMPGMTGLELVRSLSNPPAIILTTAYREYAAESYELDVVDYLLKPITIHRFMQSINRYMSRTEGGSVTSEQKSATPKGAEEETMMYVNVNRKHVRVIFDEILYVESLKDYVSIHLPDQKITTKNKISDFEGKLPSYFLRVHRSFIVNRHKITAFTAQDVEIGSTEIPIGVSFKREVLKRLEGGL